MMNKYNQLKQLTSEHTANIIKSEVSKEFWKVLEKVKTKGSFDNVGQLEIIMHGLCFMEEETQALEAGKEILHAQETAHKEEWINDMIKHYREYKTSHSMDSVDSMLHGIETMINECKSDCDTIDMKQRIMSKVDLLMQRLKQF